MPTQKDVTVREIYNNKVLFILYLIRIPKIIQHFFFRQLLKA